VHLSQNFSARSTASHGHSRLFSTDTPSLILTALLEQTCRGYMSLSSAAGVFEGYREEEADCIIERVFYLEVGTIACSVVPHES
jgi:hypothetical protein